MKVMFYGTRGSIAVSGKDYVEVGGNTTSLRIFSDCIPREWALAVDGGTGFRQLSKDALSEGILNMGLIQTHHHDDHIEGIKMAGHTHHPGAYMRVWGPVENEKGPREVLHSLMSKPRFPVLFDTVENRFKMERLRNPSAAVLVVHPRGGFHLLPINVFLTAQQNGKQIGLGGVGKFFVDECLVIKMWKTSHPNETISYRIEERPTGRVLVILTDHENTDEYPQELLRHVEGCHLLIQDCQYARQIFHLMAGRGHGTPDYCAGLAIAAKVPRVGFTHHDPEATDSDVRQRLAELKQALREAGHGELADNAFACVDYMKLDV